jgi:hypothetical protein
LALKTCPGSVKWPLKKKVPTSEEVGEASGEEDVGEFAVAVALQGVVRLLVEEQVIQVDLTPCCINA